MPIRKPRIMPADSVSRSVAVLVRAMRPHISREFVDGGLQADDGDDVHPLQLGLQAGRERHAAALDTCATCS